jgi:sortase B
MFNQLISKAFLNTKPNQKNSLLTLLIILFSALLLYSLYMLINWQIDTVKAQNQAKDLKKIAGDGINLEALQEINPEAVAWLNISGTGIDYPVVQTKNNDYYLNHAFDRNTNQAGWIFGDYRNDFKELDQNTIIYGHGLLNGIMFGTLKNTLKDTWYKKQENQTIKLTTETEVKYWQVFSIYHVRTTDDYLEISFNNNDEFQKYMDLINERSIYNFNNKPNVHDKILTLSTCYGEKERIVVHAKLISSNNVVK